MHSEQHSIVTRAKAKAAGAKRYYNGKPCPAGHVTERMASNGRCVTCLYIARDGWRSANPEKVRVARAAYYAANRETELSQVAVYQVVHAKRIRAKSAEYKLANLEKVRAWQIAWRAANPDKVRAYIAHRRALKLGAGGTYNPADVLALFKRQRGKCAHPWCGKSLASGYHIDHVIPLSRGGSNDRKNLALLCQPCNNQKWAHHPVDFAQSRGFLL